MCFRVVKTAPAWRRAKTHTGCGNCFGKTIRKSTFCTPITAHHCNGVCISARRANLIATNA
ncbi:UNVERIFIED_CONTAM: hypothetical protein GTU68_059035 [Idotea baltica]|nr:hypothetical protein [Idotea baltica]